MQPRKKIIIASKTNKNNSSHNQHGSSLYNDDYDHFFKIKLLGDSGVGKSCLLLRYVEDTYTESYISTIGVDFKLKFMEIDSKRIKLQIWDTAGQDRFRTIESQYARGVHGAIIVFDLTDQVSFNNTKQLIEDFNFKEGDNKSIILVGNKSDLRSKRIVSDPEIEAFVNENPYIDGYIETSAKNSINVNEAFKTAAQLIMDRELNKSNKLMDEHLVKKIHNYITKTPFEVSGIMPGVISGETIYLDNGNKKVVPHFVKKHWEQANLAKNNQISYTDALSNIKDISNEALKTTSLFRSSSNQNYYLNTRDITANTDLDQTSSLVLQSSISVVSEKQNSSMVTSKNTLSRFNNIIPTHTFTKSNQSTGSSLASQSSSSSMSKPSLFQSANKLFTSNKQVTAPEAPKNFICPITLDIMKEPVTVFPSGHTYEKSEIEKIIKSNGPDPLTRGPIERIAPNHALRNTIEEWKEKNGIETPQTRLNK